VGSRHQRGGPGRWSGALQAPPTLWTFPRAAHVPAGTRLERVIVYEVLSFFDGERYIEIRRTPVRTIPLAGYTPITTLR
jgi:hypothetical protein